MLKIENLKLMFNDTLIFRNINLEIKEGEVICLTGLSGSGKSSLLKILNGIIPEVTDAKLEGKISYKDHDLLSEDILTKSNYMSTVYQNPKTQFYCINSTDELAFGLENRAIPREEILSTINKYTKLLKTEDLLNRDIFSLSGGQKQLLAITAVACLDNDIYLFDEPSASLDHDSIKRFKEVVRILKEQRKIVIIAEHRLYYLKELMDRLVVIDDKQAYQYDIKEVLANYKEISLKHHLREINETKLSNLDQSLITKVNLLSNKASKLESEAKSLECLDFKISFDKPILDLSINFTPGVYFIVGENAVGKSTFVRSLCKLNKAKGKRRYDGKDIKKTYDYISMVMQDVNYQIFTESCAEELGVISDNESLIDNCLKEVNLYDKKEVHPQTLSGGEKQRLLIAKALVSNKPIVILDEPTSGLDKLQMERIVKFLDKMKEEQRIVLVITHDYELIKEYKSRILEFIR